MNGNTKGPGPGRAPEISVIVTTRNEAANIAACIAPFRALCAGGRAEVIVVDNGSEDGTRRLAEEAGARVVQQGPERSAQRNRGAEEARGAFLLFLDADMIVPEETAGELLARAAAPDAPDAMYVREVRTGRGIRTKARNFERGFYDATCIDCVRLVRKTLFLELGGFDLGLTGPEDWDLDRRVRAATEKVELTRGFLLHNEKRLSLAKVLQKKAYYGRSFARYREKWGNDAVVRKQFGFYYRFIGVFVEKGKWRRILRHPLLFAVMMAERFCVGLTYLKIMNYE